ncbi:hypothetical protein DFQ00_11293 [Paenibacillus barcinonensis]|uniref:Uncharacterized protein n=1 Tax=Paenibacillus barcinonensis TaxID=198119 RepID=A0A2V4WJJ6_PAEBA|nr:hypothetical protein DFQ00_11293 [Paenibacillus barcinonensis]
MQKEPCANTTFQAISAFKGGGLLKRRLEALADRILSSGSGLLVFIEQEYCNQQIKG